MALEMRDVYSSHVNRVGHDPETNELHVWWDTGRRSVYEDVPPHIFDQVSNSWSVGKAIHSIIKPVYSHRYLDE